MRTTDVDLLFYKYSLAGMSEMDREEARFPECQLMIY